MPAVTPERWDGLPRLSRLPHTAPRRGVLRLSQAPTLLEGAGFPVRRPFPSRELGFRDVDPFLLLDHLGPIEYRPGEAKGAPWHPHRGFETVTYMIDGIMRHRDSHGGGGLITNGDTQWMTAGAGILHDEMPPDEFVATGGLFHGIQLWVNLPRARKWAPPRYQSLEASRVTLVTSPRQDALLRVIAGNVGGFQGPGVTWTPVTVVHASLEPDAELELPWPAEFNALAYVLMGTALVGPTHVWIHEGHAAMLGSGAVIAVRAATHLASLTGRLEILLLGGRPIKEPIAAYGPFVMNSHAEIIQAFDDYQQGRMGQIPARELSSDAGPAS